MEKKASLYNTELHLGMYFQVKEDKLFYISAHQSHAKTFIINKLKAKCKEASTQLRQLELREADIDQKQQVLRDMKNKIERNAAIVDELESDIGQLMEAKGNRFCQRY